jgi:hypothetical protein
MAGRDCGIREKFQEISRQRERYFETTLQRHGW